MIVIRIGDVEVPCASAEIAVEVLKEISIVVMPETEAEAEDYKREAAGVWIGPIVAEPKERRN